MEKTYIQCGICKKDVWKRKANTKFCSKNCANMSKRGKYFFNRKGITHTEETKEKFRMARVGRRPALGMKHSLETKLRIRDSVIKTKGRGGRVLTNEGYVKINFTDKFHPNKDSRGYVLEHRLVAEKKLKRFLHNNEIVHHINGNVADNRPENLFITNASEHNTIHKLKGCDKIIKSNIIT